MRHVLNEYIAHYHHERNHQGLDNLIPFPDERAGPKTERIVKADLSRHNVVKAERLGGLLNFYYREAA